MSATFASPVAAVLLAVELLLFELQAAQPGPGRARQRGGRGGAPLPPGPGPLFPVADVDIAAATAPDDPLAPAAASASPPACCRRCSPPRSTPPRTPSASCRSTGCGGRRWAAWSSASAVSSVRKRSASGTTRSRRCCWASAGVAMTVRLMLVKATIWSVSLGSGTSGGVLAPLLMMGERARRAGGAFSPRARCRVLAARQHGARSWAARCARR